MLQPCTPSRTATNQRDASFNPASSGHAPAEGKSLSAEGSQARRPVLSVSVLLLVVSYIKELSILKNKEITGLTKSSGSVFFMIVTAKAYPS